ncbi:hypothetical protein ACFQ1E_12680 [Sphingomonas canadensis]|uniref:Uncharacterized protein n=1 Tax=Sphingomonas canadensis TaxID=1219257 RepID=A0ABW3H751_9SPHN|nr:hypothetical protein [Sphingomonas canadensis]MCW3836668.1 hypothetical protein [Sphingomonas canadensis]
MRKLLILLAFASAPAPAMAADLATLGCVAEKLPLLAKAQLEIDVERNMRESGKRPTYDAKLMAAIKAATEACAAQHKWAPEALQPAALYTRAKLSMNVAERVAGEHGFDAATLETIWVALPEERRDKPLDVAAYRQLADAAVPEGDDRRTAVNGEFLSEFFQLLSVQQYSSVEFAHAGEAAAGEDAPAAAEAPTAPAAEAPDAPAAAAMPPESAPEADVPQDAVLKLPEAGAAPEVPEADTAIPEEAGPPAPGRR